MTCSRLDNRFFFVFCFTYLLLRGFYTVPIFFGGSDSSSLLGLSGMSPLLCGVLAPVHESKKAKAKQQPAMQDGANGGHAEYG